jgi:hypothetical protein
MHVFVPYGSCIYCGSKERPLGKEHIVPYGLCSGNQFILPKASCDIHSAITSKFERAVLRGPMWPVRAHLQLKSRHSRVLAPVTAPVVFTKADGTEVEEQVPLADHPLTLFFPLLHPPSELTGNHRRGVSIRGELTFRFGKEPNAAFLAGRHATGLRIKQTYTPVQFAQLLGKIAWGFAAGQRLLDYVDPAQSILPALVADPDSIGRWVGSADSVPTIGGPPAGNVLHEVLAFERRGYLLYRIQLFGSHRTPYYWAIVGRLGPDHPRIEDPIAVSDAPVEAAFVEVLQDLQPGAMPATAPSRMTAVEVKHRDGSTERFRT